MIRYRARGNSIAKSASSNTASSNGALHPSDERLEQNKVFGIRKVLRNKWKKEPYHRRSLVETAIMRQKNIWEWISSRRFPNQAT